VFVAGNAGQGYKDVRKNPLTKLLPLMLPVQDLVWVVGRVILEAGGKQKRAQKSTHKSTASYAPCTGPCVGGRARDLGGRGKTKTRAQIHSQTHCL